MVKYDFWSVKAGIGMGPLMLGADYKTILSLLREHGIDIDRSIPDQSGTLRIDSIGTQLVFSSEPTRALCRIDVDDERLRFGSLPVIGKRVHEIIGLFKMSKKEIIWSPVEPDSDFVTQLESRDSTERSRELLARGTVWIVSLGLGLTLRDGLVAKVHLSDPETTPRHGIGQWTKEQRLLSEVREVPTEKRPTRQIRKFTMRGLIHLAIIAMMFWFLWWAIPWKGLPPNKAPDVPATGEETAPPTDNASPTTNIDQ